VRSGGPSASSRTAPQLQPARRISTLAPSSLPFSRRA
jgi:hypothetical protein